MSRIQEKCSVETLGSQSTSQPLGLGAGSVVMPLLSRHLLAPQVLCGREDQMDDVPRPLVWTFRVVALNLKVRV